MKYNDLLILANLRENARETLTRMSKRTRIPVSTIFERLKNYDKNIVKKYTSIIDFTKLGYNTKALILINPMPETRNIVEEFLQKNKTVNSLYKVSTNFEYLAEVICRDMQELQKFLEVIEGLKLKQKEVLFVIDDLKKEDFMSSLNLQAMTSFGGNLE